MSRWSRGARLAVLAAVSAWIAGCGLGPGDESEGEATLTVTRDYGSEVMVEAVEEDPVESETVIRFLDREAEITTRYGGGFVQSIEGVSGEIRDGRSFDWFFFVNGIESSIGSADAEVSGGDRIWWDHRDWSDAMRAPAVVGSWPEPFKQDSASDDERLPVRIECEAPAGACEEAADRLADAGVDASVESLDPDATDSAVRMLVGPWDALRDDDVAGQLDDGPATSGVFAGFERSSRGFDLVALDERSQPALELERGAGLVAALRDGESPPTWIVTATDEAGVDAAIELLDSDDLSNRYAVAARADGRPVPLPVLSESG